MPRLQQQPPNRQSQPSDRRADRRADQRAKVPTGTALAAAPAEAAMSRTALASALVCERRRVALHHRRRPTAESRAALAAIDLALAEYQIDIPALEQARAARRPGSRTGSD